MTARENVLLTVISHLQHRSLKKKTIINVYKAEFRTVFASLEFQRFFFKQFPVGMVILP